MKTASTTEAHRKILVTVGLPYANGPLHLGHIFESTQADIWARTLKMQGHEVHYVCGDDTHGTPILLKAKERNQDPEALIGEVWKDHKADYDAFGIDFSIYSSTHSPENKALCEEFYGKMKAKNTLSRKSIDQLYCEHDKMFLPDRFVKGTCPNCGSENQNGDSCDVCAAAYSPADLKKPHCAFCGSSPIVKSSEHIFFELNPYKEFLSQWLKGHTAPETSKKMHEWFGEDLRAWDISRDDPYFGIPIPGEEKKFFYVWVDAPMGYVSATKILAEQKGLSFDKIWRSDSEYEVHHFIGKDIVYFHTLFWPALLKTADFRLPSAVHVHGFISVNGEKMSKSKGNFIMAKTISKNIDPEYLRFYFATKMNSSSDDMDFATTDLVNRVNSDWVGKITNLASRGAQMLLKQFDGNLTTFDETGKKLFNESQAKLRQVPQLFVSFDYSKAMNVIREVADSANRYFDEMAPWKMVKEDPQKTQAVLTTTLNIYRLLAIALKPVVPKYSARAEKLLLERDWTWKSLETSIENVTLECFVALITRVEEAAVKSILADTLASQAAPVAEKIQSKGADDLPSEIEMDDFMKVDLRVALVLEAEAVEKADKLLRLKVQVGEETRQIFAGIKKWYAPADLIGKKVLVVFNLKPRKMKFGMSEGMVLAAEGDDGGLSVLVPEREAAVGSRVK